MKTQLFKLICLMNFERERSYQRVKHTSTVKKTLYNSRPGATPHEDIYDCFKKGLNNMMAGGGFTVPIPPLPKNPKQTKDWKSIRFTVISWRLSQGKPARCISCRVLRDQRHVA
jgi:hypothetical protein